MRNRVFSVGDSCFEVINAIELVEPCCEFAISNSGTAVVIELYYFELIRHEMSSHMG
jgi:hypothetical protein